MIFSFVLIGGLKGAAFPKEPVPVFGNQVIYKIPDGPWDELKIFQVIWIAIQLFRNLNGRI